MHRIPKFGRRDVERVWLEEVTPRRPFQYTRPVVVLADHWTGSMGEGVAVGFDALHRAVVVGTSLGQLNGSVQTITLDHTQYQTKNPSLTFRDPLIDRAPSTTEAPRCRQ